MKSPDVTCGTAFEIYNSMEEIFSFKLYERGVRMIQKNSNSLLIRFGITLLMPNFLVCCFKLNNLDNDSVFAWRVFVGTYFYFELFILKILFYLVCIGCGTFVFKFLLELLFKETEKPEISVRNHEQIQMQYVNTEVFSNSVNEIKVFPKAIEQPKPVLEITVPKVKTPEQIRKKALAKMTGGDWR